jgi:bla regulator protein blaR1
MTSNAIQMLAELTLATSIAVAVVALLRRPLRWVAGVQVAYWLWLLVPISALAVLLPPLPSEMGGSNALAEALRGAVNVDVYSAQVARATVDYSALGMLLWLAGGVCMVVLVMRRQLAFLRSLGDATAVGGNVFRSAAVRGPLLVGILRPRIVLSIDFESKFTPEECASILAHERAHLRRGDLLVGGIATLWLCLFWFNPLMYWALARLRRDQELACDAVVLGTSCIGRRRYADALLRTQLASEDRWRPPLACCWQADHPLKERIVMLSRPPPTFSRRLCGALAIAGVVLSGGCAVWSARPAPADRQPSQANSYGSTAIDADLIAQDGHDLLLSGNVVLTMTSGSTPVSMTGSRVTVDQQARGQYKAELHDLRISDGKFVVTAERGTVEYNGTKTILSADSVRISPIAQMD